MLAAGPGGGANTDRPCLLNRRRRGSPSFDSPSTSITTSTSSSSAQSPTATVDGKNLSGNVPGCCCWAVSSEVREVVKEKSPNCVLFPTNKRKTVPSI